MKHIVIAGGSGYLGQSIEKYFSDKGCKISILTRQPKANNHIYWAANNLDNWSTHLNKTDVLINLTGRSVDCRYTKANKAAIRQSRLGSTRILHKALHKCSSPPHTFINASSATIYEDSTSKLMTERTGSIGDDFSMNVVKDWEASFFKEKLNGLRQVALRTSIVLGQLDKDVKDTGAFPKLKRITQLGLGGQQGSGLQMVSWIHIEDFCRAVDYIINDEAMSGPINITAPHPVSNKVLMSTMRSIIKPIVYFNQPVALLQLGALIIGTETELILKSRNVYPEILLEHGFDFKYPSLQKAMENILR